MIEIEELKKRNKSYFSLKITDNEGKEVLNDIINFESYIISKDDIYYYMLYDNQFNPISEVFTYINSLIDKSENTKEKILYSLRILYIFLDLNSLKIDELTFDNISNFIEFLKGVSVKGLQSSYKLITHRSNGTINGYLAIYRSYVKYLGIIGSPFLIKGKATIFTSPMTDMNISIETYDITLRNYNSTEVPKYISYPEYAMILSEIEEKFTIREECIVRLMYENGLRIGEVLGLTGDDVVIEKIEGEYRAVAYIRNRVSDKSYQKAKTCMNVGSVSQYKTSEYKINKHGYQKVEISDEIYNLINEYIETEHDRAMKKYIDNYYKHCVADRVRRLIKNEASNYYIFLNTIGKPLSSHLWNITLRKIFTLCNILIDKDIRGNNLNHRFRHGFAMYHVQVLKIDALILQEKLRHGSLKSISDYYNPTDKDKIKLKEEFEDSLRQVLPGMEEMIK